MNACFIYQFSLLNSEEFKSLDQYYQFLNKGQDINWNNWFDFNKFLLSNQLLKKQKKIECYFRGEVNLSLFRPTVLQNGLVVGNPVSFLASYYRGDENFYDII